MKRQKTRVVKESLRDSNTPKTIAAQDSVGDDQDSAIQVHHMNLGLLEVT